MVRSLFIAALVLASSQRELTLAERARRSDRVVIAHVLDSRVEGQAPRMTTVTSVLVRESIKGDAVSKLEVVQLGGTSGLWESHLPGDAVFEPGETAVLFLHCRDPNHADRCVLFGLAEAKLPVKSGDVLLRTGKRALESVVDEVRRGAATR